MYCYNITTLVTIVPNKIYSFQIYIICDVIANCYHQPIMPYKQIVATYRWQRAKPHISIFDENVFFADIYF